MEVARTMIANARIKTLVQVRKLGMKQVALALVLRVNQLVVAREHGTQTRAVVLVRFKLNARMVQSGAISIVSVCHIVRAIRHRIVPWLIKMVPASSINVVRVT